MPYPVKAVANAILNKTAERGDRITHMKLQKLLYYVCGFYIAAYEKPLIDHTFEAWDYGPVVPALYREFQRFGNKPISGLATDFDWDSEDVVPVPIPSGDRKLNHIVDHVLNTYGKYSATQLSDLSHAPGSPWDQTRKSNPGIRDADIPNDLLLKFFEPKIVNKKK